MRIMSKATNKEASFSSQQHSQLDRCLKHYDLKLSSIWIGKKTHAHEVQEKNWDMFTWLGILCCHLSYSQLIKLDSYIYKFWLVHICFRHRHVTNVMSHASKIYASEGKIEAKGWGTNWLINAPSVCDGRETKSPCKSSVCKKRPRSR